ncbi:hypothetical protein [Bacillus cereus]|uniref:hypothetical protein n=1 Tax=Bacillus cereus TaxID=1396 RepID=UPI00159BBD7A|nr:hypothetical protein [Bacillus cereus]HDR8452684.1 hypothetical protein [Bacillus cereus]HDR8464363.1 hypothetical protein [Bacillus cereus]
MKRWVVNIPGRKGYKSVRIGAYTSKYIKFHVPQYLQKQNTSTLVTRVASSLLSPLQ